MHHNNSFIEAAICQRKGVSIKLSNTSSILRNKLMSQLKKT